MRAAADELRAELAGDTVTFVVNRNINVSNVCIVGCAFCGFGQGKRSPDAYEHSREEFATRVARRARLRRHRDLHPVGHPPRLGARGLRGLAAATPRSWRPTSTCTPTARWRSRTCATSPGSRRARSSPACARPGSTRRPAPPPRCSTTACASASARTSCRSRAGSRSSRRATREGLRSTVTVMFGHIEEPDELAEHMRVVRELQARTGGFTEFVPLSFIPFHTLLGRTHGIEEISREENLKHTAAFRLALGRSVPSLQASWVKMGLDAATEALRWGVNDLGGTLMEESISRMAGSYHGVRLEPAGPDRRRARRRAPRGRAHDALRHPRALRAGGRGVRDGAGARPGAALRRGDGGADLGRDRRALQGLGARLRVADVLRRGPPLRARASATGLEPGTITPYEVRARRRDGVAAAGQRVSAERRPHPRPGPADADRVRLLPRVRAARAAALAAARTSTPTAARSTRCGRSPTGWREQDPAEWPEALILLGDQVYADEVSPGVREFIRSRRDPEVPPGETVADFEEYTRLYWESWGEPYMRWLLSTVPIVDDLRRPRRPRRLEHVEDLGHRHARPGLVGRADRRRLHVATGSTSTSATSRRASSTTCDLYARVREADDAGDILRDYVVQGRPRGRGHALELLPRHRPGAAGDGRLARRAACSTPASAAWSTRTSGSWIEEHAQRRLRPPADRHLAAAAARARACTTSRPGTRRSATARGARSAAVLGEKLRQGARPRALGGVRRVARADDGDRARGRHGRARRAAGVDRRAVGRRPPRLPRRGRASRRAPACARPPGRRRARRSATRSTTRSARVMRFMASAPASRLMRALRAGGGGRGAERPLALRPRRAVVRQPGRDARARRAQARGWCSRRPSGPDRDHSEPELKLERVFERELS